MPNRVHVGLLITLTLEPLSTIHPEIFFPCNRTLMAGFWWSMTVDLGVDSAKLVEILTWVLLCNRVSIICQKRGARFSSVEIKSQRWVNKAMRRLGA